MALLICCPNNALYNAIRFIANIKTVKPARACFWGYQYNFPSKFRILSKEVFNLNIKEK